MGVSSYPGAAQSAYVSASAAAVQAAAQQHHVNGGRPGVPVGVPQQQQDCLDYEAKFQVL